MIPKKQCSADNIFNSVFSKAQFVQKEKGVRWKKYQKWWVIFSTCKRCFWTFFCLVLFFCVFFVFRKEAQKYCPAVFEGFFSFVQPKALSSIFFLFVILSFFSFFLFSPFLDLFFCLFCVYFSFLSKWLPLWFKQTSVTSLFQTQVAFTFSCLVMLSFVCFDEVFLLSVWRFDLHWFSFCFFGFVFVLCFVVPSVLLSDYEQTLFPCNWNVFV